MFIHSFAHVFISGVPPLSRFLCPPSNQHAKNISHPWPLPQLFFFVPLRLQSRRGLSSQRAYDICPSKWQLKPISLSLTWAEFSNKEKSLRWEQAGVQTSLRASPYRCIHFLVLCLLSVKGRGDGILLLENPAQLTGTVATERSPASLRNLRQTCSGSKWGILECLRRGMCVILGV